VDKLVKGRADRQQKNWEEDSEEYQRRMTRKGAGTDWLEVYYKKRQAERMAEWDDLVAKVKKGIIQPASIPVENLTRQFFGVIVQSLAEEGLIDVKTEEHWFCADLHVLSPEFNAVSEKIIARRVLEEVLEGLKKFGIGPHEVEEIGFGEQPSHKLREFDDLQHTYDMLDIQETLFQTAHRDPVGMQISQEDLKARLPLHKSKSSFVILMDCSYSMLGPKFIGTVMAALAFRELLQECYKEDRVYVIGYNERPFSVLPAEILRLQPYGYTDIGLALDLATMKLSKEDGNRVSILITDGEPTCSACRDQTPEESALRAASKAGKEDVQLNIIMLDKRPELRRICDRMARLNGNATLTYVDNPLNLKDIVIKSYLDYKRRRAPFGIRPPS